jgi:hypothetical protein
VPDQENIHVPVQGAIRLCIRPQCVKKVGSNFPVFSKPSDTFGRDISYHDGHQICNNYNWARGCVKPYCKYSHVCKQWKSTTHGKFNCDNKRQEVNTTKQNQPFQKSLPIKKYLQEASTPTNYRKLRLELANHPDKEFAFYLCNAILYGFDMLISDSNIVT